DLNFIFFFQAEDGIRDRNVTGVQTCALPIYVSPVTANSNRFDVGETSMLRVATLIIAASFAGILVLTACRDLDRDQGRSSADTRSEERRVGKEGRYRGWQDVAE